MPDAGAAWGDWHHPQNYFRVIRLGMVRRPRGDVGKNHQTIGSDILAVRGALQALTNSPAHMERILGPQACEMLEKIRPSEFYPIDILLSMMDSLERHLGRAGLVKMGRTLFLLSHAERFREVARTGRDVAYGIDGLYHHANRGLQIGGWRVVVFDSKQAILEKSTPHHCWMEEGLLAQALTTVGCPAVVSQPACFREGAPLCRFVITPAPFENNWG